MEIIELPLKDLKLLKRRVFFDDRGFFSELYRKPLFEQLGIESEFAQINHSFSKKGTIRGMHFQSYPGQAKLINVIQGEIFDVAVDIRKDSPTFGKWVGVTLNDQKPEQLLVPVGFAHGFCVMSETAHVMYQVSTVYDPVYEKTFRFDDPKVGIEWPVKEPVVSTRDQTAPLFDEVFCETVDCRR